jgi:hypothetical protein
VHQLFYSGSQQYMEINVKIEIISLGAEMESKVGEYK